MNIFENLSVTGEIKTELIRETFSLEVGGVFKITKGLFTQEVNYWARIYTHKIEGCITVDDHDMNMEGTSINGFRIDDINKLKKSLVDAGLKSVSDQLGIDDKDCVKYMYETIQNNSKVKLLYGDDVILWQAQSDAERNKNYASHIIKNWNTSSEHEKKQFGIQTTNENGVPSLEELCDYRNAL